MCQCRDEWIRAIESVSEKLQVLEDQEMVPMEQDDDPMAGAPKHKIVRNNNKSLFRSSKKRLQLVVNCSLS